MNICLVTPGYPPEDGGGIATYTYHLATGLKNRGNSVFIITKSSENCDEWIDGILVFRRTFRYIPKLESLLPGWYWSWYISSLITRLNTIHQFDIIEFPNWEGPGYVHFKKKQIVPAITRLHTAYFETLDIDSSNRRKSFGDRMICLLEKKAVKSSEHLVSSAEYHKYLISEQYEINPERITNIPLGVEIPQESGRLQTADDQINLLYVGRLEHRKGALDLIHALDTIIKSNASIHLTFVGNDRAHAPGGLTHQEYVQQKLPHLSVHITFVGYISFEEVTKFYRLADIFVLPSYCENFGLVYVEAMMYGLPVVGYNNTAIPEVITNNSTGCLVSTGSVPELVSTLTQLVNDKPLRETLGQNAKQWAEQEFNFLKMAERTETYYQQIIKNSYE